MVTISIFSLIYRSTKYAEFLYRTVHENTPMIKSGDAEFFFVANNATPEVIAFLYDCEYPFVKCDPRVVTDEGLRRRGYAPPEYIRRVYMGYNYGINKSKGEIVVMLNSDMLVAPDWLENLIKYLAPGTVITPTLVERHHPRFRVFPGAVHAEFGDRPGNIDVKGFHQFSKQIKSTGLTFGGAYMPLAAHRDDLIIAGLYPEGNLPYQTADDYLFDSLANNGIKRYTSMDSIVYHWKEGEKDEGEPGVFPRSTPENKDPVRISVPLIVSGDYLVPDKRNSLAISTAHLSHSLRKYMLDKKARIGMRKNEILHGLGLR